MATAGKEEDQDQDAVDGRKINHNFLSLSQITALSEEDIEGIMRRLTEYLNLKELQTSLIEVILLDYYTAGFCWAKEKNFNVMQMLQFMDLLNFLLENLRDVLDLKRTDRHMSLEDNIRELGKAMSGIGETNSERSGDLDAFNTDQAKAVIDFMNISLLRLYKLYAHLFYGRREEHVISYEYMVELAPRAVTSFPAPPEEGVSSDFYASLLALPADMERKADLRERQQMQEAKTLRTEQLKDLNKPIEKGDVFFGNRGLVSDASNIITLVHRMLHLTAI